MVITKDEMIQGTQMLNWMRDLWPLRRSLTGPGVRQTLEYLSRLLPGLRCHSIPSGSRVFDWTVPDEWALRSATLTDPLGNVVLNADATSLHVVGYSEPVETELDLEDLQPHLHSLPDQPEAIPYVTSYYRRRWGLCLQHRVREHLLPGRYRVHIDSELKPGQLDFADLVIPGESTDEVLLSTYICHPEMANNELSGPVMVSALGRWLLSLPKRRLSYRLVFVPETIGSIAYIQQHLEHLRQHTIAGYVVTCVGDNRAVSFLESRLGNTLADRVARHVLGRHAPGYKTYPFWQNGSDERQYCSPLVDLPVASVMRSKYATYPEYHTSLDDLSLVSAEGLGGAFALYRRILSVLESNQIWQTTCTCEPQLGKRGLYPTLSTPDVVNEVALRLGVLAYCDSKHDLLAIADRLNADALECAQIIELFSKTGLVVQV